jgi:hypothetical protein
MTSIEHGDDIHNKIIAEILKWWPFFRAPIEGIKVIGLR